MSICHNSLKYLVVDIIHHHLLGHIAVGIWPMQIYLEGILITLDDSQNGLYVSFSNFSLRSNKGTVVTSTSLNLF